MYCCPNCFNDEFLASVIKRESQKIGNCDFCNTQNTNIIKPEQLNYYFQPLLDLYEPVESDGRSIAFLLKNDWMLFIALDMSGTIALLELIIENKLDGEFLPKKIGDENKILNWQDFKQELKHDNRYFPKKAPSKDDLDALLIYLTLLNENIPQYLYRSRVNIDTSKIEITQMGKPPGKLSTAGRANPVGIPYLYTASNIQTAIAEIRPHKGDTLTVAKFEVKESIKLADLRNPRHSISPFSLDEDGLNQIFMDLDYLCHLGEELSKPILPREAHLEYLSSQYLCELIKHCGFDGVVYKSSVGDGDNYAIFSDEKVEAISTEVYTVDCVEITSNLIEK